MKSFSTIAPLAAAAFLFASDSSAAQLSQHGYSCLDASYLPNGEFSHYGCGVGIADAKFGIHFTTSWCDTYEGIKDLCYANPPMQAQARDPIVSRRTASSASAAGSQGQFIVPAPGHTVEEVQAIMNQLGLGQATTYWGSDVPAVSRRQGNSNNNNIVGNNGQFNIVPAPGHTVEEVLAVMAQLGLVPAHTTQPHRRSLLQASSASTRGQFIVPAPGHSVEEVQAIMAQLGLGQAIAATPNSNPSVSRRQGNNGAAGTAFGGQCIVPAPGHSVQEVQAIMAQWGMLNGNYQQQASTQTNVVSRRTAATSVPVLVPEKVQNAFPAPGSVEDMASALSQLEDAGVKLV